MPDPIPLQPRQDDGAADARSLEQMGRIEPQPIPEPATQPFQEPAYPDLPDGYEPDLPA
ncbi:hypothetical protein [Streptomyces sp. E5N298]|uniref:hypothetical protein n=1 Tax=Streptomyces sp. E5N298 TaxID=1851983 RepID=UPI00187D47F3|nr:hypothetical protein [Streptomyces sp. E5N298]